MLIVQFDDIYYRKNKIYKYLMRDIDLILEFYQ